MSQNHSLKSVFQTSVILVAMLMAVSLFGCGGDSNTGDSNSGDSRPNSGESLSADDLLRGLIEKYKSVQAYSDRGTLRLKYKNAGKVVEELEDLETSFTRPNKLRISAYNVELASDGKSLRYKVIDQPSGNMDQQFVNRPVANMLDLKELFNADPILSHFISGIAGAPLPVELLMAEKPMELFFEASAKSKRLDDKSFDGIDCYRVQIETQRGEFTLWIDREQMILRKFEYPVKTFLAPMIEIDGIRDLSLVAEFPDARFEAAKDDEFDLSPSRKAKQVRYFVTLPPPLPTTMFGKRPDDFRFVSAGGGKVTQQSLDGGIGVLMWFNNHPAGQINLLAMQKVAAKFSDVDKVKFFAVCTEPSTRASTDQVKDLLKQWNVDLPLVRDLHPFGKTVFGVRELPTLIVVDAAGIVQYFEVLTQPNVDQTLPAVIERLKKGDDLAAEILQEYRQEIATYNQALQVASVDGESTELIPLPESKTPKRTDPVKFKLTKLWRNDKLAAPGNITVVRGNDSPDRILVHDGFRTVVEINLRGETVKQNVLELPERSAVTFLRTFESKSGERYFVAGDVLGQQIHLFDSTWKRTLSYPPAGTKHGGIRDVQIADMDDNGEPELYVGYWETIGVQQVSLDGVRSSGNRIYPKVLSLAVTKPNDVTGWCKLLATDDRGKIVQMNQYLRHDPPQLVHGQPIHELYAARFSGDEFAVYCGLSYADATKLKAVGLNAELTAVWEMKMTPGVYGHLQPVTSGQLFESPGGQWVFARPDGSIHIKSDDGSFEDRFFYGEPITGIAVARIEGSGTLLVATEKGIFAWHTTKPDEPSNPN